MKMTDEVLLLSIHPEYAARIFDGKKTVELRKIRPRMEHGDGAWNVIPLEAYVVEYIPEPAALLFLGLGGLFLRRRRA